MQIYSPMLPKAGTIQGLFFVIDFRARCGYHLQTLGPHVGIMYRLRAPGARVEYRCGSFLKQIGG